MKYKVVIFDRKYIPGIGIGPILTPIEITENTYRLLKMAGYKVQVIEKIQPTPPSPGKKELPDVTSEDNGDVLTVVEGAWNKAKPSGGNNDFVVTYTENDGTYTADKTFAEIKAAIEAGKNVKAVSDYYYLDLYEYYVGDYVQFCNFTVDFGGGSKLLLAVCIYQSSDNTIQVEYKTITTT